MSSKYSIEFIERGEQFRYTGRGLSLVLERTYCRGHRIFTQSIAAGAGEPPLSFAERSQVLRDLCEFFETCRNETVFVIWDTDPHRRELETLLAKLQADGELISIERDNDKNRQAAFDRQNLELLRDGWKVTLEGREFRTAAAYEEWMKIRSGSVD